MGSAARKMRRAPAGSCGLQREMVSPGKGGSAGWGAHMALTLRETWTIIYFTCCFQISGAVARNRQLRKWHQEYSEAYQREACRDAFPLPGSCLPEGGNTKELPLRQRSVIPTTDFSPFSAMHLKNWREDGYCNSFYIMPSCCSKGGDI